MRKSKYSEQQIVGARQRAPTGQRLCPEHAPPLPPNAPRFRSATGSGRCHGHNASSGCSLSTLTNRQDRRFARPKAAAKRSGTGTCPMKPASNAAAACASSPASSNPQSSSGFWAISATRRCPSIRRIRAERRRRATAWSERSVLSITTRATVQGRAAFGLRRDAPAFPAERKGFTCPSDAGPGRLREMAASICRRRPGFGRYKLAPTVSLLT